MGPEIIVARAQSGGMIDYPIRVLFLCTGNSARSQIAEALLKHKGGDRFLVASAGAQPADAVRPEAIAALEAHGIDWSTAKPKGFDAILDKDWDLVLTLCDRVKESCPSLPNRPVTGHWGVPDPSAVEDPKRRADAFAATVKLLAWRLDLMLAIRLDQFESLILEQRLQAIASQAPPDDDPNRTTK